MGIIEGKASLADVKSLAQRQAHPALPASRSLFPVHFCEPPPGVPSSRLHQIRYVAIVIVIDGTGLFCKTGMFLTCSGFRLFIPSGELAEEVFNHRLFEGRTDERGRVRLVCDGLGNFTRDDPASHDGLGNSTRDDPCISIYQPQGGNDPTC